MGRHLWIQDVGVCVENHLHLASDDANGSDPTTEHFRIQFCPQACSQGVDKRFVKKVIVLKRNASFSKIQAKLIEVKLETS